MIPTAREFLESKHIEGSEKRCKAMIEFAKLHVTAALKEALEEVPYGGSDSIYYEDVEGILTCYSLDLIK